MRIALAYVRKKQYFEGTDLALKRARPPRNYVLEMQPILQTLTPFLKTWLCHLIEPSPIHSLVSKLPSERIGNTSIDR